MFKLNYNRCGEFWIPDMGLSTEDRMPLGKYGTLRYQYLKEHRPGLFARLLLSGQLMHQLHEVDRTAAQRMDILLPQMMTEAGTHGGPEKRRSSPVGGHDECHYGADR